MNKLFAGAAMAALLGLPLGASAQSENVVINGSLINWYYYGMDKETHTTGWWQQPTGGGAWIDENGVAHPDGAPNIGLLSLILDPGATKPLLPEFLIRNTVLYSNAGGVYTGDAYYSFFMGETGWEDNMEGEYGSETYVVKVRKWTWDDQDEATGLYKNVKYQQVATMTTQPIDLTYDPYNDIVYGIFYDGSTYKIGTLDMETFKVKNISREGIIYGAPQCIAINSKGEIYAIDASGNVYTVSKTDGKLTTIGNVGFKSQPRRMSATFDFRTDKLYWIGFMNDGKKSADTSGTNNTLSVADGGRDTGVYEVDTETGVATLVGKTDFKDVEIIYDEDGTPVDAKVNQYGKMQMTGIYVEGSFTKKNIDQRIVLKSYPSQLKVGETGTVTVDVKNIGLQKVLAKNYVVNLYVNGALAATIDRDSEPDPVENLEKGESQTLTFEVTAQRAGTMKVYAEVVNAADEEPANNKTEVASIIVLSDNPLPGVTITGSNTKDRITLSWVNHQGFVTDGAEDYAAFTYDGLGSWTMVDGDGGYTQKPNNLFGTVDYPNWNTPKAFIVMNPVEAGLGPDVNIGGEKLMPYDGDQFFAGFYSAGMDGAEVDNDDYMVSPVLSGEAQTISFWAKGYRGYESTGYVTDKSFNETLEVLYTTDADNLDPTTYLVAKEEFSINDKEWTEYTADLPAGAKHFALHRTSKQREYQESEFGSVEIPGTGSFIMMIDDIHFQVGVVTGFNVYKNGEKIATQKPAVTIYTGNADQDDQFYVTVVYGDQESDPSNIWSINPAVGVDALDTDAVTTRQMFDLNGRALSGQLRPGIYVVKVNGKTRKVIVK